MAKISLTDLTSFNENSALSSINTNNALIEAAIENTLSRDGTSPDQMLSPLDMNSNPIINLPAPSSNNSPVRLQDVISGISTVTAATGTSGHTVPFLDGNNVWSGTNSFSLSVMRERLLTARTYYVRTDGNDSNTGLVNNAAGAFLTITHAVATVQRNLDIAGQNVTIQVGNGTYAESVDFSTPVVGASCSGQLQIIGDTTTPSNVIVSGTAFGFRTLGPGPDWLVRGFRIVTSAGPALYAHAGGWMRFSNIETGTCGDANGILFQADHQGILEMQGNASVTANAGYVLFANSGAYILGASGAMTLVGTPTISNYFVYASDGSRVRWVGPTFSGSATGTRFYSDLNSVIVCSSGVPNTFWPGNANGTTATGGQSV